MTLPGVKKTYGLIPCEQNNNNNNNTYTLSLVAPAHVFMVCENGQASMGESGPLSMQVQGHISDNTNYLTLETKKEI